MGRITESGKWAAGGRGEARIDRTEAAKEAFRRAWRPDRPIEGAAPHTGPAARDRHLSADAKVSPTAARKHELEALDPRSRTARQLSPGARAARQAGSDSDQGDTRQAARQLFELAKHGLAAQDVLRGPAGHKPDAAGARRAITELARDFDDRVEDIHARTDDDGAAAQSTAEANFDEWLQENHGLTADEFDHALDELDEDEQEAILDVVIDSYESAAGQPHDTDPADHNWTDDTSEGDDTDADLDWD